MAPSNAAISSVSAALVAKQSSARKLAKYSELAISHIFVPIVTESFGPICTEALSFIVNLNVAYLKSLGMRAKKPSYFNVYPLPFNVLSVLFKFFL